MTYDSKTIATLSYGLDGVYQTTNTALTQLAFSVAVPSIADFCPVSTKIYGEEKSV